MLNECTLTAIEGSGLVLFILGLDISILRNAKICLNLLESLQQRDKIMLIVNREVDGSVTTKDVQKIMDRPIVARFPTDWKLAVAALNKGVPFVLSAPSSALSKSVAQFAHSMADTKSHTVGRKAKLKK
jgi:pilus assembly protein CpaE